jgi:predicted enzyme related to lactoylglutathione lyase
MFADVSAGNALAPGFKELVAEKGARSQSRLSEGGNMATVTIKTNPVNWFEIPVKDVGRARKFYEKVFGKELTPEEMGPLTMAFFPMEQGVPGAAGTLIKGESYEPSHAGTVVYFSVDDIEETLRRIHVSGGKTLMPKQSIGEYGFIAHFEDTEGNRVALHSMK